MVRPLNSRAAHFAPGFTAEQMRVVENWARTAADPAFRAEKEKPFQGQFITDLCGGLLGYVLPAGHLDAYNLKAESASVETKGGKTPGACLGFITSGTFANANFAAPSAPGCRPWRATAAWSTSARTSPSRTPRWSSRRSRFSRRSRRLWTVSPPPAGLALTSCVAASRPGSPTPWPATALTATTVSSGAANGASSPPRAAPSLTASWPATGHWARSSMAASTGPS